jgi:hypothetical protein
MGLSAESNSVRTGSKSYSGSAEVNAFKVFCPVQKMDDIVVNYCSWVEDILGFPCDVSLANWAEKECRSMVRECG